MLKRIFSIMLLCIVSAAGAEADARVETASVAAGSNVGVKETATRGEAVEMHLPADQIFTPWIHDPNLFEEEEGDRIEMREVVEQEVQTIKLENVVPPIHFRLGEAQIPEDYIELLRGVLNSMRDRVNVRLHFIGHSDNLPLSPALTEQYGDNTGLSRERAGNTAEYFQRTLGLPPEAISYEGFGESQPVASNATEDGRARNRRVEVQVWYDEIGEKLVEKEVIVPREVNRVKICRTETVCKLRYREGHSHRARVRNLIAPLHYEEGMVEVPEEFLRQIRQSLNNLRGKQNIVVKFTSYTDNTPLVGRNERIYGNHLGLSKAVARRVSLAVQDGLALPSGAIDSEGRGATQPAASNDTEQGRALNRRVEVEFWHDDPLQELPADPQLCPDAAGAETVTRIYDSPLGPIPPILFEDGQPILPEGYTEHLRRIMDEISDRSNVRLRFVGHTSNERLDRRTAAIYGDDIGWSTARARRAMDSVSTRMALAERQVEFEGRGYVQSDDVVNAGFVESDTSRVQVQVVYDELAILDDYEGLDITRLTREVSTGNPFGLNLMRITVDGKPLDDPGKSIPDVQRCTDISMEKAKIRFKHDNLKLEPRLNVTAWPRTIRYQDDEATDFIEDLVRFRMYTNYRSFIERAEVRIFEEEQSVRDTPLAVIEMNDDGMAQWQPSFASYSAPGRQLQYLVRVYDEKGHFDETVTQPLWVADQIDPSVAAADYREELLVGYGESRIASRNIPLAGGSVQVHGTTIPAEHGVWLAGYAVPVDSTGSFVAEEILPDGMHTVEVAVLDKSGNGELFLRDLALKSNDWFYVGIADLTLAGNKTNGPARLLSPDRPQYSDDLSLHGRLAFYTTGKFGEGWGLTASADTREGPLDDIFSNFMDKSPEALFRRIDPEYHFPTYGDDGTVTEDAPTSGKFYVKLNKDENYGLWGNFRISYTDNNLAHVDRGLYGANLHYQTLGTTSFGEQRFMIDGFAADPGTQAGRDEFRGTGGSLYFLRRQDVLTGSERVRIEVRDKDSGLVLGVKNLTPVLDYDIDYLQGRMLLSQPLAGTADDSLLVHSDSVNGHPVYLVVRYEFTPEINELDTLTTGGRVHYWLNDYVKVGFTGSSIEEAGIENSLYGGDLLIRKNAESWLKLEGARTKGEGVLATTSIDGGFDFGIPENIGPNAEAGGYRIDASLGLKDIFDDGRGQVTFYLQDLEAGYSAPGLNTNKDLDQFGGTAALPLSERVGVRFKGDKRAERDGLETSATELNAEFQLNEHWTLSPGVRHDKRKDNSPIEDVPLTQEEGERTDMVAQLLYDSRAHWTAYGFAQETLKATGNREDNLRFGTGGSYRVTDRFKVTGEIAEGDLGTSGRLGTEYLYTDRTNLYLNYTMENERADNGLRARKGNMASGFRTRYSDSASVYLEERYIHGDVPTGLTHSTGVELAPVDRLNLGANLDFGTLKDQQTGAELKRRALGVNAGYGFAAVKLASALEYRVDETEDLDTATSKRTTWLLKNSLRYQLNPDWRLLGKFNYAQSKSSQGRSYDGNYVEAVVGSGYRPIHHDRLNALLKYTYFYNVPAVDQVTAANTPVGFIQRSHIGAVDVMYDLSRQWTVGGKYAYRHGEVSQDRVNREFFDSRAHLYVLRADWHIIHRWDVLIEGRLLDLPDAQDRLDGVLVGVYRHLGNYIKLGAGYNFSSFSDDLTNLDYKHQGLFLNLIGKM
jgi:flagellar motor protein MotB